MLSGPGTTIFSGAQSASRTGASGREAALAARQQHLAVAHQEPRLSPTRPSKAGTTAKSSSSASTMSVSTPL